MRTAWLQGTLLGYIWTSVSRGLLGFLMALAIAPPLGLLVARVRFVRTAIGPILPGLQTLPSVAWVPPAVDWLGLNDSMIYSVILLGAVPSIANGLVAGIYQIPPLFLRAGRTLGATGLRGAWHIAMPGELAPSSFSPRRSASGARSPRPACRNQPLHAVYRERP